MSAVFEGHEVRRAMGVATGGKSRRYEGVAIDSRRVSQGNLFIALQGARVDGFDYLEQAARRGAVGAVIPADRTPPDLDLEWFPVANTLRALGELARHARRRGGARVIGITGSSGKTTAKEMLALALSETAPTWATPGNLNSLSGLPLAIFDADPDAKYWVLEMGSSAPGEISRLASIAEPNDAIVTTVGAAHLEGLGNLDGVLREKLSLIRAAQPSGKVVVGEVPLRLATAARWGASPPGRARRRRHGRGARNQARCRRPGARAVPTARDARSARARGGPDDYRRLLQCEPGFLRGRDSLL